LIYLVQINKVAGRIRTFLRCIKSCIQFNMTYISNADFFSISAKTLRLIRAFSLKRNLRTLLDTESTQSDISCLHGIRSLNAIGLIIFHKSAALFFNPYVNRTYMTEVKQLCNWLLSYSSETIRTKCLYYLATIYRGADKSLARPGRKQATGTKL